MVSALIVGVAYAQDGNSPLLVRVRVILVEPDESSDITAIGGEATADSSIVPELDISYFLTANIAAELVLAVTPHDISARGTTVGDVDLGDVWLLPPALTLQYHIAPDAKIRPYVGAGINYTVFLDEDPGSVATDIDYEDGFGYVLQTGVDVGITDQLAINVDVKKLYLNTDVEIDALGTTVQADVDLDPWIIGVGAAYRF